VLPVMECSLLSVLKLIRSILVQSRRQGILVNLFINLNNQSGLTLDVTLQATS